MPIMAPVDEKTGELITQFNTEKSEKERANSNSTLGKEAFLQLLVAQMQYQDPLEPMDNTEYVTQLATFSQLESLQNMQSTLSNGQATDLVGKTVMVKVTDANGDTNLKPGVVDYVIFEGGKPYLVINEEKYPYEDLDTVLSDDYMKRMENYELANAVVSYIKDLPNAKDATLDVYDKVMTAKAAYDSLTDEQKALVKAAYDSLTDEQKAVVGDDYVKKLNDLVDVMEKLAKLRDEAAAADKG